MMNTLTNHFSSNFPSENHKPNTYFKVQGNEHHFKACKVD